MIIAVTGTPGTGKTSVSRELSKITGLRLVGLNDVAKEKGLYVGQDRKRGCMMVDIPGLRREVSRMRKAGVSAILESHYAHDMHADIVVLLRTGPAEIRKRGISRGWSAAKAEENAEAEIMEVCSSEAFESGREVLEFDTTGKSPAGAAAEIALMLEKQGFFVSGDLAIGDEMRERLRQPYGRLFTDFGKAMEHMHGGLVFAVGDRVSRELLSAGVTPDITVVDGRISRQPVKDRIRLPGRAIKAKNNAGTISRGLWKAVQEALCSKMPVKIEVLGEEDMAVLPLMLLSGDGASIVYGLFQRGICVVRTGPQARCTAREILRRIAGGGNVTKK